MASERATRVDVGFQGGQVLDLRLRAAAYDELKRALVAGSADRWHELEAEDAKVAIDLSQVVYLRLDSDEHKVGF